jgi:segregation and condensation protein B
MTEHEASAIADEAGIGTIEPQSQAGAPTAAEAVTEATSETDAATGETVASQPAADETAARPEKKRRRKSAPAEDIHPSLFAINLDDPELPSHTMPFELRVEAAILLADRPISDGRLAEVLGLVPVAQRLGKDGGKDGGSADESEGDELGASRESAVLAGRRREAVRLVREAVDTLNRQYADTNRAFRIESVSGGRQMLTISAYGPILAKMKGARAQTRLSQAALETLAIIAYRQPMLRAQLEAIRGVACGEVLKSLMERRLVKIVGRSEEVGRPMLYGTTPEFLRVFGIANLSDLPQAKDLRVS